MSSISDVHLLSVCPHDGLSVSSNERVSQNRDVYRVVPVADVFYESASSQDTTNSDVDLSSSDPSIQRSSLTSDSSEKSFQESLEELFSSIQPDSVDTTTADESSELATDSRYGDALISLTTDFDHDDDNMSDEHQSPPPSSSSPFNNIAHDNPLASHPFFSDLRHTLEADCNTSMLPSKLFHTLGNNNNSSHNSSGHNNMHHIMEEQSLKIRLQQLEAADNSDEKVKELSTLFQFHVASIEMERMNCLVSQTSTQYSAWLNSYFDGQKNQAMDRVKQSLRVLEESRLSSKNSSSTSWLSSVRHRPTLSRKAIQIMEQWYQSNLHHPYPSATVVEAMTLAGGISSDQVKKWFGNKRNRGGNTRSLTEIARRKHRQRQGVKRQRNEEMIGNLAQYL